MKRRLPAFTAILAACLSCVEINSEVGSNLLPGDQVYDIYIEQTFLDDIDLKMADSLSGYSQTNVVIGAIRDAEGRLSTRSSAVTIVPLSKELDFGKEPQFRAFHLGLACDTVSTDDAGHARILQNVRAYELSRALTSKDFDCNASISHSNVSILRNTPVLNGKDSLSMDMTEDFAKKFFSLTKDDLSSLDNYLKKIPGIYLETDDPIGEGGRLNNLELQFGYDSDSYQLTGNCVKLSFNSEYEGTRKDTCFFFMLGATDIFNGDSLLYYTPSGARYSQYALNLTNEESVRDREGKAGETIFICGGGGIKPRIPAAWLKKTASEMIAAKGGDPQKVIINKASLVFPFEFPEDYTQMSRYPVVLSPTTRIRTDTTATFVSLTDASDETEDSGDINRSLLNYSPDFSYHLQTLLTTDDKEIATGKYDVWLLVMNYYTVTTDNSNSELSQYYEQLAYQSYYNNMYGGYGGYGGYGYGGYGYNSYTNYYNYMMMAQYAANNVSVSSSIQLDIANYYRAYLCGPQYPDETKRPILKITFSVPRPEGKQ